jgi:hypothetical protein
MILVAEYDHFIEGARFDWMHPSCGRWPDLAASFLCDNRDKEGLLVAIWWDGRAYAAVVEGPGEHHQIMQTYRWVSRNDNNTLWWCRVHEHQGAELDTDRDANIRLRQIAQASCQLFMDY